MDKHRVVVVGGGYAGVVAASRLTTRDDVEVTLVNPRPDFVERIRLHQLVAGNHPATLPYAQVVAGGVDLVVDEVTRIVPGRREVELRDGGTLGYDYLVYAVGSRAGTQDVPGAAEHALPVATFEAASRLRDALAARPADPVTVVGGGTTGIEVASELAGAGRSVTLVCRTLGPSLHPRARRSAARQLAALGVAVREGVTAARVTPDAVGLSDGGALPGLTVWTAGFEVPDLARRSGLRTDDAGRLLTDETLTSVDDDRVVGAGDAVAPSGGALRMSCQAAGPLGAQAAQTILARLAGREPAPITNGFVAQCVSVGRDAGVLQLARRDDTPVAAHLAGRGAAWAKEYICTQVAESLRKEARRPGSFTWFVDKGRAARAASTTPRAASTAAPVPERLGA